MSALRRLAVTALLLASGGYTQTRLKPGFNFFTKEQDIRLGREAAAEIEKQVTIIRHPELNAYLESLGRRLASRPEAGDFPYSFALVHDNTVNAFALPGGPTYVHTGLILAADSEGELAGVMAHEIAHVALRHGTSQVSKANLIAIPAMLASAAIGEQSLLAKLGQLGVSLGANSLLLKYSRSAEREADLLGTQIMAGAGYDPLEMVRLFEKLEAKGGARGLEFFSSHPNPGNRRRYVEQEAKLLTRVTNASPVGDFVRIKELTRRLGEPPAPKSTSRPAK